MVLFSLEGEYNIRIMYACEVGNLEWRGLFRLVA